jgi:hypothetical protein
MERQILDKIDLNILSTLARDCRTSYNSIQDKLPEEYQNCMTGINQVLKICWEIVNKSRNSNNDNDGHQTVTITYNKTVLQALALINDCNKYKMDLTTWCCNNGRY